MIEFSELIILMSGVVGVGFLLGFLSALFGLGIHLVIEIFNKV